MKTQNLTRILILGLFFISLVKINAQDLHYSQFYNSQQNINPALTGIFKGDHRFTLSMRDQWRFVPVPWFTLSGSYDRQYYFPKNDKHFLGLGAFFNHDRQGDCPSCREHVAGNRIRHVHFPGVQRRHELGAPISGDAYRQSH